MEYKKETRISTDIEQLFRWHERKGAVSRLTPPWVSLKLVNHSGGIETGTQVHFILKIFGIPFVWQAEHIDYKKNILFRDQQTKGPFKSWIHTHGFEKLSDTESLMVDHVRYQLPFGIFGRMFGPLSRKDMARIFTFRHRVLKDDLEQMPGNFHPMTILVSGASGTIGSALVPFLMTCGHRVIRLVRRKPDPSNDEVFWDPDQGILDLDEDLGIDAVINLNGLDISRGRWTDDQKDKIIQSRTRPTALLIKKMSQRAVTPKVFLSSSAIGYYGHGGERLLTEADSCGDRFISGVCREWEDASRVGNASGMRVVQLRIGIVLTPAGGAVERMVFPFLLGLGTKVSRGDQYMSWISMEDTLGSIHHILFNEDIKGPVNLTAPNPVTNKVFTTTLARVLNRPAWFTLPSFVVRLLWGQMGEETLLDSARVAPQALAETGYQFRFTGIENALRHALGRYGDEG